jgi:uncharacterized protein (DUF433 family)
MEPIAAQSTEAPTRSTNGPTAEHPADRVRIVCAPGICGGRPRIDGHRIQVEDVAIWHERMSMSPDEIVSQYPSITLAEVHAALAYYYENRSRSSRQLPPRGTPPSRFGLAFKPHQTC